MSEPFLSSDDYDERAHQLYNDGQYDEAIDTLREGLGLYPHAIELHVGVGYARLAREEYAWARRAFDEAVSLDPDHEDALAGLGEVLLKFGDRSGAVGRFDRILALGFRDDHDLMLQIGRALFREGVLDQARRFFEVAVTAHADSAEAAACVGYAAHRLNDEGGALYWLRRALELDPAHAEARIYLANLLYDRGEYEAALFHLERTEPDDHFDGLAIWRLLELKKSVYRLPDDDPELVPWHDRLGELARDSEPDDLVLAEIEAMGPDGRIRDPRQLELFGTLLTELQGMRSRATSGGAGAGANGGAGGAGEVHRVSTPAGVTYVGTWAEIVRQMKDDAAEWADGSVEEYMTASAQRGRRQTGIAIPATDPESFIKGSADAGLLRILH
ncbi:MAG: tetratricopeptide repeat protein [Gemmatimonadales bacterium]